MKMPSKSLLMLLLCLTSAVSFAQNKPDTRPKLFASLPETIKVNDVALKDAFNYFEGQNVSIVLADNLVFTGVVLSNEVKYSNLQSVIVRSSTMNNSLLSVSKMINPDKTISYTGRIINNNAFDGFEIQRNTEGQYNLHKIENGKILELCSY